MLKCPINVLLKTSLLIIHIDNVAGTKLVNKILILTF